MAQEEYIILTETEKLKTILSIRRFTHGQRTQGFSNTFFLENLTKGVTTGNNHRFIFNTLNIDGKIIININGDNSRLILKLANSEFAHVVIYFNGVDANRLLEKLNEAVAIQLDKRKKALAREKAQNLMSARLTTRRLPSSLTALTGSYLTGFEGPETVQSMQLREIATRPFEGPGVGGKRRKTRRTRKH